MLVSARPVSASDTTDTSPSPELVTAFITASADGYLETLVKLLAEHSGGDEDNYSSRLALINAIDGTRRTALTEAIAGDHQTTIRWLIQQGADPDLRGQHRLRPLALAVLYRRFYIARMLLIEGANPNPKDPHGSSPLHYAARSGDIRLIRLLLRFDANINMINVNRVTPLMDAVKLQKIESVKFFINRSANPFMRDKHGLTAAERSAALGHSDITQLLTRYQAHLERKAQP